MAMTDEQEKEIRAQLEEAKAQLKSMQDARDKEKLENDEAAKAAESKRAKEKPQKPVLDPDIAKQIVSQEERIKKLEARLGTDSSGEKKTGLFNLFG